MKTILFQQIEAAIGEVIGENCEDDLWDGYIHNALYNQMAVAAAAVFDAAMDGQAYAKKENER